MRFKPWRCPSGCCFAPPTPWHSINTLADVTLVCGAAAHRRSRSRSGRPAPHQSAIAHQPASDDAASITVGSCYNALDAQPEPRKQIAARECVEGQHMGDDQPKKTRSEADAQLEREIRDGRKFSLEEAIGRLAGPGMMKGVSPATRKQQAEAAIESYLDRHLMTPAGAMSVVLLRRVKESEILLSNLDQPLVVLASCVQQILESEYLLQEIVRESDVEWGRAYGERPFFDKEGQ